MDQPFGTSTTASMNGNPTTVAFQIVVASVVPQNPIVYTTKVFRAQNNNAHQSNSHTPGFLRQLFVRPPPTSGGTRP